MRAIWVLTAVFVSAAWSQEVDLTRLREGRAYRASSNNPDLASNDDSLRPIAGETVTLADLKGPGVVTHIWITVAANEYGWPRLLRLRVYYDGSATPSVDAPLGDFFAAGHGYEKPVNSLVVVNGSSGRSRNSYWKMPFRKSCRITVTNEGRRRVSNLYYHVDWEKRAALAADTVYFHAWYKQEIPTQKGKPYTVLSVKGRGHYAGTVLSVIQNEAGWFGEGDDLFYVDGEKEASIQGTGTEDYFNDAWSLRVSEGPYWGVTAAEGTGPGSRMTAYRWHLRDPIPFRTSLRFDFEHAGWTYNADGSVRSAFEERADLFSSVAFWYQQGIAQGLPAPPYGYARLPHGNARQVEVESLAGEVKTEGGSAEVQREVFWSRDLLTFRAEGAGSRIDIPFEVSEAGRYELLAQIAHAPDYGEYRVLLDGKPLEAGVELEHEPGANMGGGTAVRAWHSELYVAEDHLLGWRELSAGRHTVSFVCTGKDARSSGYSLGLDTLILARIASPEQTAAPRIPPDVAGLVKTLASGDAVLRGLACVALRDLGAKARAALPALIAALRDPEVAVRMRAADAITELGAVEALDALIAAAGVRGEQVHVQRSVAIALGRLGPAAKRAIPVLRELEKVPRVGPAAGTAIRRIEGR